MNESKRRAFAERLARDELISAPGVYDGASARIARYMTGYGVAASHLGLPDAGIATCPDMVSRHSMRGYERAGAVAMAAVLQTGKVKAAKIKVE
jgi:2-methylisocitrate lyase-like PEP mutase family enzyme